MKTEEFKYYLEQYEKEPVIFFFEISEIGRDQLLEGLTREQCVELSDYAIPLSDFDTDWNDSDGRGTHVPDPQVSWCYVSMPEKK